MSCEFAHDDGAYVLGALAPAERQEFERHLPGCADCTRAVGELAGLPGLLGQVDASVVEGREFDEPVPDTLLPALSREVRQARRRRTWASAGLAAAAAVAVVVALAVGLDGGDETATMDPGASSSPADPAEAPQRMQPVGEVPVRADVTLEQVTWGTRLGFVCTYDTQSVDYELPPEVDYTLYVRTRDGRAERVGSWRSVDGQPMRLTAGTASTAEELKSVEVRTAGGRVVLRLPT
ncbi:MAG: anti-sigma factor family protein [Nocardioides sp.]